MEQGRFRKKSHSFSVKTIPKDDRRSIKSISLLGRVLFPIFAILDRINLSHLIDVFMPLKENKNHILAQGRLFAFLYTLPNTYKDLPRISEQTRRQLYSRTLDHTSNGILQQFARAVLSSNKRNSNKTKGVRSTSKEYYIDHIKNIKMPYYLLTFGDDLLSNPTLTKKSIQPRLNTVFAENAIERRGHEDIFLHESFHADSDQMINFLVQNNKTYSL